MELVKVDADNEDNFDVLAQYEVQSIPTIVAVYDGRILASVVGFKSEPALQDWIDKLVTYIKDEENGQHSVR